MSKLGLNRGKIHRTESKLSPAKSKLSAKGRLVPMKKRRSRGGAAVPAGTVELVQQANLAFWLDPTDLTGMWQEEAKSNAVTTDGHVINLWTNQGTDAIDISESAGFGDGPTYKTNIINGRAVARFESGGPDFLANDAGMAEIAATGYSFMFIFNTTTASALQYISLQNATTDCMCRIDADGKVATATSDATHTSTAAITASTWRAVIRVDGSNAQATHFSQDALPSTSTDTSDALAAAEKIIVGSRTNVLGNDTFQGDLGFWGIWKVKLTAAEIADAKTWATQEFGVAWA